jgi:hypothetical protein
MGLIHRPAGICAGSIPGRAPEQRDFSPLADARIVGNEPQLVDERGGDDQLIGRVFVEARWFQGRHPLGDGGRDGQDGEFRRQGELEKFRHRDGQFQLAQFHQLGGFPERDVGERQRSAWSVRVFSTKGGSGSPKAR